MRRVTTDFQLKGVWRARSVMSGRREEEEAADKIMGSELQSISTRHDISEDKFSCLSISGDERTRKWIWKTRRYYQHPSI